MPIYEYLCNKCGKKFEKLVFDKTEEIACPDCGSKEAGKQFSSFSGGSSRKEGSMPSCPNKGCCPGCRN